MKIRVGNSANAKINREWGAHVRRRGKKITSGKRRIQEKQLVRNELSDVVQQKEGATFAPLLFLSIFILVVLG